MKSAARQVNALSGITLNISETDDIDKVWSSWKTSFLTAINAHVLTKTVKDTYSSPWIDKEVLHHIRKKCLALKKYRQNKTENRKRKLRELSNTVKCIVKKKHCQYLNKVQSAFAANPKVFWSYHAYSHLA